MLRFLVVALGGAVGALIRYLMVSSAQWLVGGKFPIGTLLVNMLGSFCIGFLMTLLVERLMGSDLLRLFLIVGFLGGFTTFSSLTWETWSLYQNGQFFLALSNLILNNCLGLVMLSCGIMLARA